MVIPKKPQLTEEELCDWIEEFLKNNHYAVSVREIAEVLGFSSSSSTWSYLSNLREAGLITWQDHSSRTIRVTRPKAAV